MHFICVFLTQSLWIRDVVMTFKASKHLNRHKRDLPNGAIVVVTRSENKNYTPSTIDSVLYKRHPITIVLDV